MDQPLAPLESNPPDGAAEATVAAADAAVVREANRRSRRAFVLTGLTALAGLGGWRWLVSQPDEAGIPWTLRRILDANGRVAAAYFRETRLAPVFPPSRARALRVNAHYGLRDKAFDPATWRLRVQAYGTGQMHEFTLADLQALPRVEMITEFKCIEGWSTIVQWAGVRFSDFLTRYPLAVRAGVPEKLAPYVSLMTPDKAYYVGLDMHSALHPQTLLCYELNGVPLTADHGAPLRLVTPLKYGIKHIKRIGTIAFADTRPADFWAERGYDWDAGH